MTATVQKTGASRSMRLVSGPETLSEALKGSRIDARLLAPACGVSQLERVQLPRTCLDTVRIGAPLLVSGQMAGDCHTLTYVTRCPRNGHSFNFAMKHGSGYLGLFAPGGLLDAMTPAGYANATLTVPSALFHEEVPRRCPGLPEDWLRHGGPLRPGERSRLRLESVLAAKEELDRADPGWLGDPVACAAFEEDLLAVFLEALDDKPDSRMNGSVSSHLTRRYGAIRRIRDYITDHKDSALQLSDLCEVSGMSRRGLEYLFSDIFGIGVHAFIRCQRLNGARREILTSGPECGRIKRIALNWGFWHLGRFAAEYRMLFGECPSAGNRQKQGSVCKC